MSEEKTLIVHCKYFVMRKKRYCKMLTKHGEQYCGEHQKPQNITDANNLDNDTKMRIPCPLDPKHTCYAHNLKKHLKICNARVDKVEPFISKGINSGKSDFTDDNTNSEESYKLLSTFDTKDILNVVQKVNDLYERYVGHILSEKILSNEMVEEHMADPIFGDKTKKHLKQNSAVLGLLNEYQMFGDQICYIEFGAGRGQLSYWIAKATESYKDSRLLLIERASPKHKRDNKLAKTTDRLQRIRADIADLVLDKVDFVNEAEKIVGVTKHLCGEATDLAIRCVANMEQKKDKLYGLLLTFCCHHRCRWTPYTGKEFFMENNLTKNDFDIMCGIVSWATCGSGLSRERRKEIEENDSKNDDVIDNSLGLTRSEKEEIGRRCKNVLNYGRLVYLEKLGFKCVLHYYTERSVTLENVCIVAYRNENND